MVRLPKQPPQQKSVGRLTFAGFEAVQYVLGHASGGLDAPAAAIFVVGDFPPVTVACLFGAGAAFGLAGFMFLSLSRRAFSPLQCLRAASFHEPVLEVAGHILLGLVTDVIASSYIIGKIIEHVGHQFVGDVRALADTRQPRAVGEQPAALGLKVKYLAARSSLGYGFDRGFNWVTTGGSAAWLCPYDLLCQWNLRRLG